MERSEEKRQLALKQMENVKEFAEKEGTSPELKDCLRILANGWEMIAMSHKDGVDMGTEAQRNLGMHLLDSCEAQLDRLIAKEAKGKEDLEL